MQPGTIQEHCVPGMSQIMQRLENDAVQMIYIKCQNTVDDDYVPDTVLCADSAMVDFYFYSFLFLFFFCINKSCLAKNVQSAHPSSLYTILCCM
jgi:hypothetical protein